MPGKLPEPYRDKLFQDIIPGAMWMLLSIAVSLAFANIALFWIVSLLTDLTKG